MILDKVLLSFVIYNLHLEFTIPLFILHYKSYLCLRTFYIIYLTITLITFYN